VTHTSRQLAHLTEDELLDALALTPLAVDLINERERRLGIDRNVVRGIEPELPERRDPWRGVR
jgi:hypothetical protein